MRELLHSEVDFRGMTPSRTWEANDPDGVVAIFLDRWFEESEIEAIEDLDEATFADRQRVGYRFTLSAARTVRPSSSSRPTSRSATDESSGCACSAGHPTHLT